MKTAEYLIELLLTLIVGLLIVNLIYHLRRIIRKRRQRGT